MSAGLDSLALRVPDHAIALELLAAVGRPLAAPSANPSGRVSPTTAGHVADGLGRRVAMILDGGRCRIGVESTVLAVGGAGAAGATLLRPGGVAIEDIEAVIGRVARLSSRSASAPPSPGLMASHYAPELPLRLGATAASADEALLGFGPEPPRGAALSRNLSPRGDLHEAAANLFAMLRELDRPELTAIAVAPIPEHGLGLAINDRLRRAAGRGARGARGD